MQLKKQPAAPLKAKPPESQLKKPALNKKIKLKIVFSPKLAYVSILIILLVLLGWLAVRLNYKYKEAFKLDQEIRRYSENIIIEEVNKESYLRVLNFLLPTGNLEERPLNLPNPFELPPTEEEAVAATSTPTSTPLIEE